MRERERREEPEIDEPAPRVEMAMKASNSVECLEHEPNSMTGPSKLPRRGMAGGARSWSKTVPRPFAMVRCSGEARGISPRP